MSPLLRLLILSLFCLPAALVPAAENPPQYRTEIVLFSNDSPGAGDSELWPGEQEPPRPAARPAPVTPLPRSQWILGREAAALRRSGRFTLLLHQAWQQPVLKGQRARWHYLRSVQEVAPGVPRLEGNIRISVNRYLHVDLDLLLRRRSQDYGQFPDGIRSYRFRAHRRMRSNELHYIDHPLLGMLIQITPVEESAADSPEEDGIAPATGQPTAADAPPAPPATAE